MASITRRIFRKKTDSVSFTILKPAGLRGMAWNKKGWTIYCSSFFKTGGDPDWIGVSKHIVEVRRIELLSKHIRQKLSTCLFCFIMSGTDWKQTTDQFLSCIPDSYRDLSDHHSLWSPHLVLSWVGGKAWKQANRPRGPNDYLITD